MQPLAADTHASGQRTRTTTVTMHLCAVPPHLQCVARLRPGQRLERSQERRQGVDNVADGQILVAVVPVPVMVQNLWLEIGMGLL